ncbi:hypothetical protein HG535_0B06160 [Zygotorulaspora mrakii]|uniref:Uncharacterized protein n=1 Tax=Zygotorulaspora mrakii TaxID=42260 RepID=A0A7H9B1B8_ZYGMR|nr:uncharacterized protein HG535_0B06160 [Zygotorulaspora mrakii]QLG71572.1 hypothetical protein HG535_0B06160 [Zygotorulaspora mrakii]
MAVTEIPKSVIQKLIFFTVAMVIFPLSTFFVMHNYTNNNILSGGLAAGAANLVLIGYIVAAFLEDSDSSPKKDGKKEK